MTTHDEALGEFLRQAIQLALDNVDQGRAPFGALVVLDGQVVGTGVNTEARDLDPTAHAEVAAVREACRELDTFDLTGAVIVSSCEPCALCHVVGTMVKVTEIVYAAPKEFVPSAGEARHDLVQIQQTLRGLPASQVRYVPTPGADVPFRRYVEMMDASR